MVVLNKYEYLQKAVEKINSIGYHYFNNIPMKYLCEHIDEFKIVKMANGRDLDWYILRRRNNFISLLPFFQGWYPVCGVDLGHPWGNNAQTCANPIAHLTYTIPEYIRAYIGNKQTSSIIREGYPRGEIEDELDIKATFEAFNNATYEEKDVFHALMENAVYKEHYLEKALK